jgi:formylglycine-generating enzyme
MTLADMISSSGREQLLERSVDSGMLYVPGGTFRMGSDRHYPEEMPVHRVTVDGFWMDPTPVTNRQFRQFVEATGYVTFAETAPDPKDYPGALPHLKAGFLAFAPPRRRVDPRNWGEWWTFKFGANWRRPPAVRSADWTSTRSCMWPSRTPKLMPSGLASSRWPLITDQR